MAVLAEVQVVFPPVLFLDPGSGTKLRGIPEADSSGADIFLVRSVVVVAMMMVVMVVMAVVVVAMMVMIAAVVVVMPILRGVRAGVMGDCPLFRICSRARLYLCERTSGAGMWPGPEWPTARKQTSLEIIFQFPCFHTSAVPLIRVKLIIRVYSTGKHPP